MLSSIYVTNFIKKFDDFRNFKIFGKKNIFLNFIPFLPSLRSYSLLPPSPPSSILHHIPNFEQIQELIKDFTSNLKSSHAVMLFQIVWGVFLGILKLNLE